MEVCFWTQDTQMHKSWHCSTHASENFPTLSWCDKLPFVKFYQDVDFISTQPWFIVWVPQRMLALTVKTLCKLQSKAHEVYLGLQTPSNSRPHVVDWNNNVALHTHTQRENYLPLLDPVFSGHAGHGGGRNLDITCHKIISFSWYENVCRYMLISLCLGDLNILILPHPLIILGSGKDLCLSNEDVTEGPTAATLLVEAGDGTYGEGLDHQGLGVG